MRYQKDHFRGKVLVCLWFIFAAATAYAAEGGRASGQFEGKDIRMEITDAYAFRGTSTLGGKEKVIVAVVSNQGFVPSAIDGYWDRRRALDRYFKDERILLTIDVVQRIVPRALQKSLGPPSTEYLCKISREP